MNRPCPPSGFERLSIKAPMRSVGLHFPSLPAPEAPRPEDLDAPGAWYAGKRPKQ